MSTNSQLGTNGLTGTIVGVIVGLIGIVVLGCCAFKGRHNQKKRQQDGREQGSEERAIHECAGVDPTIELEGRGPVSEMQARPWDAGLSADTHH